MSKKYTLTVQKYFYEFHYFGITEVPTPVGTLSTEFDKFVDASECAYDILCDNPVQIINLDDELVGVMRTVVTVHDHSLAHFIDRHCKVCAAFPVKPSADTVFENISAKAARKLLNRAQHNE